MLDNPTKENTEEKIGYRNSRTGHMRTMHAMGERVWWAVSGFEIGTVAGFMGCIETKSDVDTVSYQQ